MYIHVDFTDLDQVKYFDELPTAKKSAEYIADNVTDMVYNLETGDILAHVKDGKLAVAPISGGIEVKTLLELKLNG